MIATPRRMLATATVALLLGLTACTPTPEPARTPTAASSAIAAVTTASRSPSSTATPASTPSPSATGATGATGGTATGGTGATSVIIPPSPTGTRSSYACAEGKTFAILAYPAAQERVTLFIEGKTLELKQQVQGSGTRHSDGTYTLISKGLDAFIEQGGVQTYRDCKASRP
ncbi:MAG: MliC family protein [Chloroflexota bacterium]